MDAFTIFFIIFAGAGITGFVLLARFFYRRLKKAYQPPKAADYSQNSESEKLDDKFNATIEALEVEREQFYAKTKGLFKRAFLRTFLIMDFSIIAIAGYMSNWQDPVGFIIGPTIMTAFLALIGAGIYSVVRKGQNNHKFSRKLKSELVTKIVSHVNPALSYSDSGIQLEDFNKSEIFIGGKNAALVSEDMITGAIEGNSVRISECIKRGPALSTRGRTEVKVGGKTVGVDRSHLQTNIGEFVEYFRGLFIEIDIDTFNNEKPIKFISTSKVKKDVDTGLDFVGYVQPYINIKKEDKIEIEGSHKFQVFAENQEEASQMLNEKLLKVADYIFNKYQKEGERIFENLPLIGSMPVFKDIKYSKSVYLSIARGKLFLALEWPEDMFETDIFLKNNIMESGLAQKIYEDLLLIDQLIKEVNLMNKIEA